MARIGLRKENTRRSSRCGRLPLARAAVRAHAPPPAAARGTVNKEAGNEWFTIEAANKTGTRWQGKVWTFHDSIKYEFDLEFDIPVSYPSVAPELALPELDGKTEKMYRGGKARARATLLLLRLLPLRAATRTARLPPPTRADLPRLALPAAVGAQRAALRSRTRWRWAWARGSPWRSRRSSRWGGSSRRTKSNEITVNYDFRIKRTRNRRLTHEHMQRPPGCDDPLGER